MSDESKCELCGEPMPAGEEMFKIHGYSGPCPAPALPRVDWIEKASKEIAGNVLVGCVEATVAEIIRRHQPK